MIVHDSIKHLLCTLLWVGLISCWDSHGVALVMELQALQTLWLRKEASGLTSRWFGSREGTGVMAFLRALQRKGPGGPPWVRMFLWLRGRGEAALAPLPSVSHTGQGWVSLPPMVTEC